MIKIKRIYAEPNDKDGYRILVDRLWPRGLSKEKAKVDLWLKEIAPSDSLRRWYSHDHEKWEQFKEKYSTELQTKRELIEQIKKIETEKGVVTFLYSAKNETLNNAVALKNILGQE